MNDSTEIILKAFPKILKDDVLKVWETIKLKNEFQISDCFIVSVNEDAWKFFDEFMTFHMAFQ